MKDKERKIDGLEEILDWLDDGDDNAMVYGVIVGLLMRNDATRERTEERLVSKWLDGYTSRKAIEDAASSGFEGELATLFAVLDLTKGAAATLAGTPGGGIVSLLTDSHSPAIAMRGFWSGLSDRDKALLCAFDAYVVANGSQDGQDFVREAVGDFDPSKVPDAEQFLLGVLMAAEGLAAA